MERSSLSRSKGSRLPVAVEPVKEILAKPGCAVIFGPSSSPPERMLHTPAGKTSFKSSPILSMQSGVKDDGLRTIVLPAASAGAIFQTDRLTGKFDGESAQTTPSGKSGRAQL